MILANILPFILGVLSVAGMCFYFYYTNEYRNKNLDNKIFPVSTWNFFGSILWGAGSYFILTQFENITIYNCFDLILLPTLIFYAFVSEVSFAVLSPKPFVYYIPAIVLRFPLYIIFGFSTILTNQYFNELAAHFIAVFILAAFSLIYYFYHLVLFRIKK